MKLWKYYLAAYSVLLQYQALAITPSNLQQLHASGCVTGLTEQEALVLEYFNGIFGEFKVAENENEETVHRGSSILGPIAANYIQSNGYSYNTHNDSISDPSVSCQVFNDKQLSRLGLLSNHANVTGASVKGAYWTASGIVNLESKADNRKAIKCSTISNYNSSSNDNTWEELLSFAPRALRKASQELASLEADTVIPSIGTGLRALKKQTALQGYRILKLPVCSNQRCKKVSSTETTPDILRGSEETDLFPNVPNSETIIFNIPVVVGETYTISSLDVNKNISPCQAIFNFYPVDKSGNFVDDPNATFEVARSANVSIAGIILAPQANIVDSESGSLGGQLLTLQTYNGHGASILNFQAASNGRCGSRSLCLPKKHGFSTGRNLYNATGNVKALSKAKVGANENAAHHFKGHATNMIILPTDI